MGSKSRFSPWLLAFACLGYAAVSARAVQIGYVYSTSRGDTGSIWRSNLDGSRPVRILSGLSNPGQVTVYGNRIYWSEQVSMTIRSANLDGSDVRTLFNTGHNTYDLEIDPYSGDFYRIKYSNEIKRTNPVRYQDTPVFHVDYGDAIVEGIAVNPTTKQVVWMQSGSRPALRRCERNGSSPVDLLTTGLGWPQDVEYEPSNNSLYWVDGGGNGQVRGLFRARADGTQARLLSTLYYFPQNLVIDAVGSQIYISDSVGVLRCRLDGSGLSRVQSTGPSYGVAVAYVPEPGCLCLLSTACVLCLRRRPRGKKEFNHG